MATIEIEVDDAVLADFYAAVGATPEDDWDQSNIEAWRAAIYLEPWIENALMQAGDKVRRAQVAAVVEQASTEKTKILREAAAVRQAARIKGLTEIVKPAQAGKTPAVKLVKGA